MRKIHVIACLILALSTWALCYTNEGKNPRVESMSAVDAIEAARRGIGLTTYDRDAVVARRVQFSGESMPFLVDQLRGRTTWRIEFDNIHLDEQSDDPRFKNRYITKLIVFLWPETGEVMKVVSAWPSGEPRIPTYPSCADQERQLKASSIVYICAPGDAPALTLLEALVKSSHMSRYVKQIYACSVMESHMEREPRAVWAIHLRGFPPFAAAIPFGASDADIPEHARNHMREVIDSKTSEWLYASTTPQPTGWLEDRF
ncbi:MAG: hypothetical protein O3A29_20365 [Planctomycetota bacterium]|nr:hypothetical protein [Planctomycetota bacterium]